jgi:long-chain fatty acid transport protein
LFTFIETGMRGLARMCRILSAISIVVMVCLIGISAADAQSLGVETHNTLMPASGGMAGASLSMPQDLTSAINGNPATLTQFYGTQFLFGGAWAEPTYNLSHQQGLLPTLGTFSAKSEAQGSLLGNIGVTQDFSALGAPATVGLGFISSAGGLVDFRDAPESNGTNTALTVFELVPALGVDVTERLSLGASLQAGIAFYDGPFVGIDGETLDYGLRGTLGANYKLTPRTSAGVYWQTKQHFTFDNAVRLALPGGGFSTTLDIEMDLPENVGFGIANRSLLGGNLLLAADILFKQWDDADLYRALYTDQWVAQLGAQYCRGRCRYRVGYAYAENPIDPNPELTAGGVTPPGGLLAIQYTQSLLAITNQHRVTAGLGIVDVLPGIDVDTFVGGMFEDSEQIGPLNLTSVESYWVGFGLTWRFSRGACEPLPVCDDWR